MAPFFNSLFDHKTVAGNIALLTLCGVSGVISEAGIWSSKKIRCLYFTVSFSAVASCQWSQLQTIDFFTSPTTPAPLIWNLQRSFYASYKLFLFSQLHFLLCVVTDPHFSFFVAFFPLKYYHAVSVATATLCSRLVTATDPCLGKVTSAWV